MTDPAAANGNGASTVVDAFADRHCGPSAGECGEMLAALGLSQLEDMTQALPADIVSAAPDLGAPLSERRITSRLYQFARKNRQMTSMIGMGYYGTEMPGVVRRKLLESPGWYTAYTPYQPEIAQGRLEMLLNFQTMIANLTGMPMAGASLLDEATAAAEAMTLLWRQNKMKNQVFLADAALFPQTLALLQTRAEPLGITLYIGEATAADFANQDDAFGALLAYPAADGALRDLRPLIATLKDKGIGVAVATDLLALCLITPPGEMGADVVVGSAQRFGLPMGAGGPHPGFIAFREEHRMRVPGRIVGVSKDAQGRAGYRLALQSREQHIRREKATSNVCTAQALPAMLATAYAIYNGPARLIAKAQRAQALAEQLAAGLAALGYAPRHTQFFATVQAAAADAAAAQSIIMAAAESNVNLFAADATTISISTDELTTPAHIQAVLRAFAHPTEPEPKPFAADAGIPKNLRRTSAVLDHPIFNTHFSEQQMIRYLRSLEEKDIALNRSMIPLGSCTMKLNAVSQMEPVSWPQFADIHPFAPPEQTQGYQLLLDDLADLLTKITGFDAISLQPNAGAQGEYAGLLTIRAYLRAQGQGQRNVCIIPSSAHGTNPASAVMAGMKVVIADVDDVGQVDLNDLRAKAEAHKDTLAALMLTYPSTCGVFGAGLREICDIVHNAGGQVYMDGANLNAMVGVSKPGELGPDVMHINLHKTFCIPHGGGGPGMGPIGVRSHLADYLPGHPLAQLPPAHPCGTISAAPFGSPLVLIISWMYIRMMGGAGLRRATLTALLNANYIVKRLEEKFDLAFRGAGGYVAHECIVDTRGLKKRAGLSVEDIAKRLMDFGYHAPTVSWPIAGALMIEPTESESKAELDRFCDVLLQIATEIGKVEDGTWPQDDNPLVNAPHPADDLLAEKWTHPYSRAEAAYPAAWVRAEKYWVPIGRIDAAHGDRNLVCTCPAPEDYA